MQKGCELMSSKRRIFPLIPDDEPVIGPIVAMRLYDNEDLITNINGTYYDKDYSDVTDDVHFVRNSTEKPSDKKTGNEISLNEGKNYAEIARQKAKEDLRQKRQNYVSHELKRSRQTFSNHIDKKKISSEKGTKKTVSNKQFTTSEKKDGTRLSELSYFGMKLRQDSYILVDLPKTYQKPNNNIDHNKTKNSFDFLKKSQIYNHHEKNEKRERQIAQELNLTRFND